MHTIINSTTSSTNLLVLKFSSSNGGREIISELPDREHQYCIAAVFQYACGEGIIFHVIANAMYVCLCFAKCRI